MPLTSKAQKSIFILGSFVVLLLAVLLYWRLNELVRSYAQIDHTNRVNLNLEYVLSYIKDAETGQRGFLVTRDSAFLEPYSGARERVDSVMQTVRELIKDNTEQVQNFTSLQSLVERRFYLLQYSMSIPKDAADTLHLSMQVGKAAMDRIRTHIDRMKAVEQSLLEKRESVRNYYAKLTPVSLLFLVFAMLLIIGFSYYGLTKQLQHSRRAAADLDYANQQLQLKNTQLEHSVEELNAFNYIASHDLKEPLRKILFFTSVVLGKNEPISDESSQYLDKVHNAAGRMKNLLDDLLTHAQAGVALQEMKIVDLNDVLAVVIENLSELLREKRAIVDYYELPKLQGVPSQMQQLFQNLITNSVKYSKDDDPPLIFITSTVIPKSNVPPAFEAVHALYHKITYTDNGIGFSQENAEKIFLLFQRLHQRDEFSGTGIGLTICKKIVQNHNGFITAAGELDKGATFTIYLPAGPLFPEGGT